MYRKQTFSSKSTNQNIFFNSSNTTRLQAGLLKFVPTILECNLYKWQKIITTMLNKIDGNIKIISNIRFII